MTDEEVPRSAQRPVELILLRQLASYLDTPAFLVDARGDLLYFNEPAEPLLGLRFEEVGELSMADWLQRSGRATKKATCSARAMFRWSPRCSSSDRSTLRLTIAGADGVRRGVEATCLPIRGQGGHLLGAIALFWPIT